MAPPGDSIEMIPTWAPLEFDESYGSETEGYLKPHGAAWALARQLLLFLKNHLFKRDQLQEESPGFRVYIRIKIKDTTSGVPLSWKDDVRGEIIGRADVGTDGNAFVIKGPVRSFGEVGKYQVHICLASLEPHLMGSIREKDLVRTILEYLIIKAVRSPGYVEALEDREWLKQDLDDLSLA